MSKVFILGAGFSKAVSAQMPTMLELSQKAIDWSKLPTPRSEYRGLSEDVEQLLTYLYQEMPWKSAEEFYLDKVAFLTITKQISSYIEDCENEAFASKFPTWGENFVNYLHRNRWVVATLNYDTIIERLATLIKRQSKDEHPYPYVNPSDLYQLPITHLYQRTVGTWAGEDVDTFRLLKLHGSTNWYSSGDDFTAGQQVYYDSVESLLPPVKKTINGDNVNLVNRKDLVPLIVPPVAEKSTFYKSRLIRILWGDLRKAIDEASEIYCIGYSIPKTDLTMNLFLRSTTDENKTIFLVNNASGDAARELKKGYEEVFKNCVIDDRYLDSIDSVRKMTEDLCISENNEPKDEVK